MGADPRFAPQNPNCRGGSGRKLEGDAERTLKLPVSLKFEAWILKFLV